jgi:hypothetical protein
MADKEANEIPVSKEGEEGMKTLIIGAISIIFYFLSFILIVEVLKKERRIK